MFAGERRTRRPTDCKALVKRGSRNTVCEETEGQTSSGVVWTFEYLCLFVCISRRGRAWRARRTGRRRTFPTCGNGHPRIKRGDLASDCLVCFCRQVVDQGSSSTRPPLLSFPSSLHFQLADIGLSFLPSFPLCSLGHWPPPPLYTLTSTIRHRPPPPPRHATTARRILPPLPMWAGTRLAIPRRPHSV